MSNLVCKIVPSSSTYIPSYQTEGSSGMDLVSTESVMLYPYTPTLVDVGFKASCPTGFEFQIRSRSGLASRGVFVLNSPGTVDSDYRGDYKVILFNTNMEFFRIEKGDRVAQMVLCPVYKCNWKVVDQLDDTRRGEGGFGHTGS